MTSCEGGGSKNETKRDENESVYGIYGHEST